MLEKYMHYVERCSEQAEEIDKLENDLYELKKMYKKKLEVDTRLELLTRD